MIYLTECIVSYNTIAPLGASAARQFLPSAEMGFSKLVDADQISPHLIERSSFLRCLYHTYEIDSGNHAGSTAIRPLDPGRSGTDRPRRDWTEIPGRSAVAGSAGKRAHPIGRRARSSQNA